VKGYQPEGIWEEATFGKIKYQQDHGAALYRRSLYQFWRRIVGPTVFFDVASRQTCQVRVARTNTPLHALVTLNDVTYVEAARGLAERVLAEPLADDRARLEAAVRMCLLRPPSDRELDVLQQRLVRLRDQFAGNREAARELIAFGESPPGGQADPVELASFTALGTLLLNLDETLTKE
jgi:hypothetical protein